MRAVLNQLLGFIEKLENFQKNTDIVSPASDEAQYLNDLLKSVFSAVHEKAHDMQITYKELSTIEGNCLPFNDEGLTTLMETMKNTIKEILASRRQLCRTTTSFIANCKLISNLHHLNISSYDPLVIQVLEHILQTSSVQEVMSQLSAEDIYKALNESPFFATKDLASVAKTTLIRTQPPFKALMTIADSYPTRHATLVGGEELDPEVIARLHRMALYTLSSSRSTSSSRSAPALGSSPKVPVPKISRSSPPSPKDAPPSTSTPPPTFLTQFPHQSGAQPIAASVTTPPIVPPLQLSNMRP